MVDLKKAVTDFDVDVDVRQDRGEIKLLGIRAEECKSLLLTLLSKYEHSKQAVQARYVFSCSTCQ